MAIMHDNRVPPREPNSQKTGRGNGGRTYFTVEHDFDGPAKLTTTVAHAVSNVTGADLTEAGVEMNNYVHPSAVDMLFEPMENGTPREGASLSFTIQGAQVTVYSTGVIVVVPPAQHSGPVQPNYRRPDRRP